MEKTREIAKLTGYTVSTVKVYFRMVYWGLGNRDAARIAKVLEWLGLSATFADGIPWWMPKPHVEISLLMTLAVGLGYVLTYIF